MSIGGERKNQMWAESGRCVAQKVRPSTGKIIVPCNTHELLEKGAHRCYFREESFNSEQRIGLTNYMNVSIFIFSGSGHHVRVCRRGFFFLPSDRGGTLLFIHSRGGEKDGPRPHISKQITQSFRIAI